MSEVTSDTAMTPAEVLRSWRLVSAGLSLERASLCMAVVITWVSGALTLIVDRSDRGLWLLAFVGGQALLALAQLGALTLFSIGADSRMRRLARLTGWLAVAALALAAVLLTLVAWPHHLPWFRTAGSLGNQMLAVGCALFVALALTGCFWFEVHAALGRDLGDARLTADARCLTYVWVGACVVAGLTLFARLLREADSGVEVGLAVFVFIIIAILEGLSAVLVRTGYRALQQFQQLQARS